jgi:hypothetical protein
MSRSLGVEAGGTLFPLMWEWRSAPLGVMGAGVSKVAFVGVRGVVIKVVQRVRQQVYDDDPRLSPLVRVGFSPRNCLNNAKTQL